MFRATFNSDSNFAAQFNGNGGFDADFTNMLLVPQHTYNWGSGLSYDADKNTVFVDAVDDAIDGEERPITSTGVYKELGNIGVLLSTI